MNGLSRRLQSDNQNWFRNETTEYLKIETGVKNTHQWGHTLLVRKGRRKLFFVNCCNYEFDVVRSLIDFHEKKQHRKLIMTFFHMWSSSLWLRSPWMWPGILPVLGFRSFRHSKSHLINDIIFSIIQLQFIWNSSSLWFLTNFAQVWAWT